MPPPSSSSSSSSSHHQTAYGKTTKPDAGKPAKFDEKLNVIMDADERNKRKVQEDAKAAKEKLQLAEEAKRKGYEDTRRGTKVDEIFEMHNKRLGAEFGFSY